MKETLGPVPTSPAGGCGARDVLLAIPGVMEESSAEYLRVDAGTRNSPGLQLRREAGKESGWPAEIEVCFLRYTTLLQ